MFIRAPTPAIFVSCPDPIFHRFQKKAKQNIQCPTVLGISIVDWPN